MWKANPAPLCMHISVEHGAGKALCSASFAEGNIALSLWRPILSISLRPQGSCSAVACCSDMLECDGYCSLCTLLSCYKYDIRGGAVLDERVPPFLQLTVVRTLKRYMTSVQLHDKPVVSWCWLAAFWCRLSCLFVLG